MPLGTPFPGPAAALLSPDRLRQTIARAGRAWVTGAEGSAAALLIASLRRLEPRPILMIAPTPLAAGRLAQDLTYFLGDAGPAVLLPAPETLPFEEEPPDQESTAARLAALADLGAGVTSVFVAPAILLAQLTIPREVLAAAALTFRPGLEVDLQATSRHLDLLGYTRVDLVENPGEYGIRGDVLDVFAPGWRDPLRVDLFGDTVEAMKWFDPSGQRSLATAETARVLPVSELVGDDPEGTFRRRARSLSRLADHEDAPLGKMAREIAVMGARPKHAFLLPLFHPKPATLFDHCPANTLAVLVDPADSLHRARAHLEEVRRRGAEEGFDDGFLDRFARELAAGVVQADKERVAGLFTLRLAPVPPAGEAPIHLAARQVALAFAGDARPRGAAGWPALDRVREWAREAPTLFVCRTGGAARRLMDILAEYDVGTRLVEGVGFDPSWVPREPGSFVVHVGDLRDGFHLPGGLTLVTEEDLFGPKRRVQERRAARAGIFELDFSALKPGDYLVHEDHGIATFGGLARMKVSESREEDMLVLLYAGGGRVYVPMDRLALVQRYIYQEGHTPRVDRLGGQSWDKAKTKARRAVRTMVRELLRIHARRQAMEGRPFPPDAAWQKEFEAGFEYEETPDQWRAIEEVKRDLESPRPMDRLVCGDVGYGKTEVALRATFKAVSDGRQVALLAPTTVLCQQHGLTFARRFAPFPATVEVLSRFTPAAERSRIIRGLADGSVDVVIGTHALLQEKVRFRNLGLLVVDEEHRFGVKDKERIKELRETVDVLTLTATPIPRTFYMAMGGLRDLSVIETPPVNRLAVRTKVVPFSSRVIREAVTRELARGGQVFFLHNRVRSIAAMARFLASVVPEARLAVGHGQMGENALKKVMTSFISGESDVLLSTSIVESGLDIPNANTMLINRADRFGLADLYQLRGRIGRSSHQAFAYLMVPAGHLTETARQRLAAIEEFSELGSGVRLAALDLEIRGAGNLLGYEQSGRIAEVGLELYTRILEEAVAEVKGEAAAGPAAPPVEVSVPWPALIPGSYLPDEKQRLALYKRLSLAEADEDLGRVAEELEDICGHPPPEVRTLLAVCALRVAARIAGAVKVVVTAAGAEVTFGRATPVEPVRVIELVRRSAGSARLKGEDRLVLTTPDAGPAEALARLRAVLLELASPAVAVPVS